MIVEVTIVETFEKVVRLYMPDEVKSMEDAEVNVRLRANLGEKTFDATSTVGTSDGGDCDWKREIKIKEI